MEKLTDCLLRLIQTKMSIQNGINLRGVKYGKYFANNSDNSVITYGEIVRSADSASTNVPTDFPSAVSIILHNKNKI